MEPASSTGKHLAEDESTYAGHPLIGWGFGLMRRFFCFLCLMLMVSLATAEPAKSSKILDRIRRDGVIRIGVKTDFAPFGMLNSKGEPEGFEIDLAVDIARQLGVRLEKVGVTTENRYQKLEQGDVDVLIATSTDTVERRQVVTAIEPNYYAGGVTVFLRPEQRIIDWQALRGQKLCATQGAFFNRPMTQRYLLDLQMYRSVRDALLALRDGRCIGFLYSSAAVQSYLKKTEWAGYKAPFPTAMVTPWSINISRDEAASELDIWLGNVVAEWHRSGFLIEREKAWDIQETRFLDDSQVLWNGRGKDGSFVCARDANGLWPTTCRNSSVIKSTEVEGFQRLGLWIKENAGMNLTLVFDPYDRALFFKGFLYSVALTGCSIFLSMFLGAAGALVVESRFTWVGRMVRSLAVFGRMTPPLLWMYLLFFGVGAWVWTRAGIRLSPFLVALWCMSFYTAASVMNTVLESVKHLRTDNPDFRLRLANFRSVVELSAGPVKAALINVVKQSVMASAIAVPELISATTAIMSDQGNVAVMMNAFLISFLLLITAWMYLIDWIEARLTVKPGEERE